MDRIAHGECSDFVTIHGRGTSPGLACGPILRNDSQVRAEDVRGAILVTERAVADDLGRIQASAGTVTVGGALLSHVSVLSREYGKPSVSFGFRSPVCLVPAGSPGVLQVRDAEAGPSHAVVEEGDVVFVDGDRGTVRVPGGWNPEARRSLRRLHRLLQEFAEHPGSDDLLARIRDCCSDPARPELGFVLEAGLVFRLVPEGDAARRLLEILKTGASESPALQTRVDLLRARFVASVWARRDKVMEGIRSATDCLDVHRAWVTLEAEVRRARSLLADLGGDAIDLDAALEATRAEAESRRSVLRARILQELAEAACLDDAAFRNRAAPFYHLVRRGRDAGLPPEALRAVNDRLASTVGLASAARRGPLILALDEPVPPPVELVGGKAAGLIGVRPFLPAGTRIPRGFVVTASAYRMHVGGEIGERLRQALREPDDGAAARKARAAVLSSEAPPEVVEAVTSALAPLADSRLAVRSSATVEDGPAGSLAGQFDTFLGVRGVPELLNRLRWAWASLWNRRALRSMAAAGISPLDAGQAVLVQEMIETVSAGVLVSRDVARGADTLLVNAAWGLGEGISQGGVPGDLFWVRRSTGEPMAAELGAGTKEIVLDPRAPGTIELALSADKATRPCLDATQLARLAALVRALDAAGFAFRDIEFGFAPDGSLVVFQVRGLGAAGSPDVAIGEVVP